MPNNSKYKLLVLDSSYSLEAIKQRKLEDSVLCRDLDGFFDHVWSVHPFASLVTSVTWGNKFGNYHSYALSERHTFIEGKIGKFKCLRFFPQVNFLLSQISIFLFLSKLIRKEKISVIRCGNPLYLGLLGLMLGRANGIPVVVRVGGNHDKIFYTTGAPIEKKLFYSRRIEKTVERFVFSRVDLVAGANEDNLQFALNNGAILERATIFRYGNLIDRRHFIDPSSRKKDSRIFEDLGINGKKFILYIGRLETVKHPEDILRVILELKKRGLSIKAN